MENNMDQILKTEDKPDVDKMAALLASMSDNEKNNMVIFLQGVKFAQLANTTK